MSQKKGFTLIELLVVIAIISLLSSIVMASLSSAKIKAQETRRIAEVKQLATALFMVADKNGGTYPSSGGVAKCLGTASTCWGGNFSGSDILNTAISEFMKTIPTDPANRTGKGDRYLYSDGTSNIAQYCTGASYPTGPFIYYVPNNLSPATQAECGVGYYACCGNQFGCGEGGLSCVYPLN